MLSQRIAETTDAPAISALTRAAYAKWITVIGREPTPMGVNYRLALLKHRFDLIERDGALVALIETFCALNHLFIENIAVAPTDQGLGLGNRLLAFSETLAISLGMSEIRLNTNAAFTKNIELYRWVGYKVFARSDIADGAVVHMLKTLHRG